MRRRWLPKILIVAALVTPLSAIAWIFLVSDCGVAGVKANWETNNLLKECARLGNSKAQAYLGMLYWSDADGEPDALSKQQAHKRGWELLRLAAKKSGGKVAANEIGVAYLEGKYGVEKDADEARKWFGRATRAGDEIAPYNFARIYAGGLGVQADLETAVTFLSISADRGYRPAQCLLQKWEEISVSSNGPEAALTKFNTLLQDEHEARCPSNDAFSKLRRSLAQARRGASAIYRGLKVRQETEAKLRRAEKPDERTCSVYADFFSDLSRSSRIFLSPTTISAGAMVSDVPRLFKRETDEREIVSDDGAQDERSAVETLEFDTSAMANAVMSEEIYSVKYCFADKKTPATFWSSTWERLYAKEGPERDADLPYSLWGVSSVGFSEDGEFALIYAESACGGVCDRGVFHLLKHEEEGWREYGWALGWIH